MVKLIRLRPTCLYWMRILKTSTRHTRNDKNMRPQMPQIIWKTHKFTRVSKFSEDVTASSVFFTLSVHYALPGGQDFAESYANTSNITNFQVLDHVSCIPCIDTPPSQLPHQKIIFQWLAPPILQPAQLQYLHLSCDLVPSLRDSTKCIMATP